MHSSHYPRRGGLGPGKQSFRARGCMLGVIHIRVQRRPPMLRLRGRHQAIKTNTALPLLIFSSAGRCFAVFRSSTSQVRTWHCYLRLTRCLAFVIGWVGCSRRGSPKYPSSLHLAPLPLQEARPQLKIRRNNPGPKRHDARDRAHPRLARQSRRPLNRRGRTRRKPRLLRMTPPAPVRSPARNGRPLDNNSRRGRRNPRSGQE